MTGRTITLLLGAIGLACLVAFLARQAESPVESTGTAGPAPVTQTPDNTEPAVVFPEAVRCDNPAVNAFIANLIEAFRREDYQGYRLMVTRHIEPIGRGDFLKAWQAINRVEVVSIRQVVITEKMRRASDNPLLGAVAEGPVYLVEGIVNIKPEARKDKDPTQYQIGRAHV